MKKVIASALCAVGLLSLSTSKASAQSVFDKGSQYIGVGIGLPANDYGTIQIPPISASYDYGVWGQIFDRGTIGLGAIGEFYSSKYDSGTKTTSYLIAPRATLHYQFVDKLDTYVATSLGLEGHSVSVGAFDGKGTTLAWDIYLGARYMISPDLAVFAELGSSISVLKAGLTFNL